MSTPYHARYFAHELTRSNREVGVGSALFNACVDLNPHQIEAAVFALRNPLSKGVILADEVGLGKTIKAGLVLCQKWAEKKRRLLVICPASLRKQWSLELQDKFNLPNIVVDSKTRGEQFPPDRVVIMSYNFASARHEELRAVPFDMVVIDEAHKLRNVYKPNKKTAQNIRTALAGHRKVLLTATPLQNSLMELFGLSTILSEEIFGDADTFRMRFTQKNADLEALQSRLQTFCQRTLRRDVLEYIQYTARQPLTIRFRPTDDEHKLYEAVSVYLMREDSFALPKRHRHLIELVVWKLLASSSPAVARTLERMRLRLERLRDGLPVSAEWTEDVFDDEDLDEEYVDNLLSNISGNEKTVVPARDEPPVDRRKLNEEIAELARYEQWARGISVDSKSRTLLEALRTGFTRMAEMGANRKALIFTESRRTQEYLKNFLDANGYAGQLVLFNGTNSDPESKRIIDRWIETNAPLGRASGSRAVDARTALVEHFRDHASVMIATEAAAEGVNLQFCSQVINYHLPWNPQRIEQRIGRCHRYGQKHDVVVINFLNDRNQADIRVHELLGEKFKLFSGLFGASDEVLGAIEDGVDFEKRILDIYKRCRTPDAIETAFRQLQKDMDEAIQERMAQTRRTLLDHFDEDVHGKLKLRFDKAKDDLDRIGRLFWLLTRFILAAGARFDDDRLIFDLHQPPEAAIRIGEYHLISKEKDNVAGEFLYRLSHPLGEWVLNAGKTCPAPTAFVRFDVSNYRNRLALVEAIKGQSGWLTLQLMAIDCVDREEVLLFSGVTDSGRSLDQETCEKLFLCDGRVVKPDAATTDIATRLAQESKTHAESAVMRSMENNSRLFHEERERVEKWAEDVLLAAERELKEIKEQITGHRNRAMLAPTLDEQLEHQKQMKDLEKEQKRKRQEIFEIEDQTSARRDKLIETLQRRMAQKQSTATLFTIRWEVV